MLIGPNKTPIKVGFETSEVELFVKTDDCENCSGEGQYLTYSVEETSDD